MLGGVLTRHLCELDARKWSEESLDFGEHGRDAREGLMLIWWAISRLRRGVRSGIWSRGLGVENIKQGDDMLMLLREGNSLWREVLDGEVRGIARKKHREKRLERELGNLKNITKETRGWSTRQVATEIACQLLGERVVSQLTSELEDELERRVVRGWLSEEKVFELIAWTSIVRGGEEMILGHDLDKECHSRDRGGGGCGSRVPVT
jgi:hypothetical protein